MNRLAAIDLNLVVALHALLEEGNVTAAAARVGLSQPAMSHALARLREHFDDPLLIRSGRAMVPTVRAVALQAQVRAVVANLERLLAVAPFDPAEQRSTLRLVTDDLVGTTVLPALVAELRRRAPGIELDVLPRGAPGRKALVRHGRADLAIGDFSGAGMDLHRAELYEDDWVCVLRRDHPALECPLTAERWAALPHLIVSPTGGRRGVVDTRLHQEGLARRVVMAVPHFLSALELIAASDLTLTVAGRLARAHEERLGLAVLSPPLDLEPIRMAQVWHPRTHLDPVQAWLRSVVAEVCAGA